MNLSIHNPIKKTLDRFLEINKIPNIIFHGPTGGGKRTLVNKFIKDIYGNNVVAIKQCVLYVDCAHGKGIKFVREELKFFAKSHINIKITNSFKIIVMANADKLTIDAQSALRRCIELYNHTTRFFIILEDKYKLLKPILSRFCDIYIPPPVVDGKSINLNKHIIDNLSKKPNKVEKQVWLANIIGKKCNTQGQIINKSIKIYENGLSGLDIMEYIETADIDESYKWSMLLTFNKIKKEFRNEKLLIFFLLNYLYFRLDDSLENVLIM
uniref:Replication factor C small subunit n=1 Tax=viral metagenome TaxID=1070528 RepID=A0A6C0BWW7_9ZZZZ